MGHIAVAIYGTDEQFQSLRGEKGPLTKLAKP